MVHVPVHDGFKKQKSRNLGQMMKANITLLELYQP
jgi:hypothetical protein